MLPAPNPPGMLGTNSWTPKYWGILEQDLGQKSFQGWRCEDLSIREVFGNARIKPVGYGGTEGGIWGTTAIQDKRWDWGCGAVMGYLG